MEILTHSWPNTCLASGSMILLLIIFSRRKWNQWIYYFCILTSIALIIYVTLGERTVRPQIHYQLELFWTVRAWMETGRSYYPLMIFQNMVLFMPFGCFVMGLGKWKWWQVILAGFLLSATVETTQLVCRIGLFEFDDMLNNTVGTGLGVLLTVRGKPDYFRNESKQ